MAVQQAVMSGVSFKLLDAVAVGVQNSDSVALLPRASLVTWQTYFTTAPGSCTILIQTSNDNVNWSTVSTTTAVAGEMGTFNTSAKFIRARMSAVVAGDDVTVEIVVKAIG